MLCSLVSVWSRLCSWSGVVVVVIVVVVWSWFVVHWLWLWLSVVGVSVFVCSLWPNFFLSCGPSGWLGHWFASALPWLSWVSWLWSVVVVVVGLWCSLEEASALGMQPNAPQSCSSTQLL